MLLTVVIFSYEYLLVILLVLTVAEAFITQLAVGTFNIKRAIKLLFLFALFSVAYVVQAKISTLYFYQVDEFSREVLAFSDLREMFVVKIRGSLNLLANVYMTPLSYFVPIENTWGTWKWIPIFISSITFLGVYHKTRKVLSSVLYAGFSGVIVVLPLLPLFLSSQSPESWRVSIPPLLGFSLGLLPLLIAANSQKNAPLIAYFARTMMLVLITVLSYISISESRLRVLENKLQDTLVNEIKDYWSDLGYAPSDYRVGRISGDHYHLMADLHPAQNMSVAYRKRGLQLDLLIDFAWRGRLLANGLSIVELQHEKSKFDLRYLSECPGESQQCDLALGNLLRAACRENPYTIQGETNIRIVHETTQRVSAICL